MQPADEDIYVVDEDVARVDALKSVFITHPAIDPVAKALDRLMRFGLVGQKAGSPARCLLVTGSSGSGKTALLRWWASQHQPDLTGGSDKRPILYVEVPPNCTIKALAEELQRQLGVQEKLVAKGTEQTMGERVKVHLKRQKVKLVILDEVQHLIDRKSQKVIYKAADFVKGLLNAGICPFVLSGTPEARAVYSENTQLKRRTFFRRPIPAYDWDKEAQRDAFRCLLDAFERGLPFEESSGLASKATAMRIHQVSDGLVGRAVDFLVMATVRAIEEQKPCLTMDVLRETAEDMWDEDDPDWYNPFDPTVVEEDVKPKRGDTSRVTRLHQKGRPLRQTDVLPS